MLLKNVKEIYTDGACRGNPGEGGWGALFIVKNPESILDFYAINGYEEVATNNQMELMAVISALKNIEKGQSFTIYTDSQYVFYGISIWIKTWKSNNWKTSNKKPVKNKELWEALDSLVSFHNITWQWVKGHSDNVGNIAVDKFANEAINLKNSSYLNKVDFIL